MHSADGMGLCVTVLVKKEMSNISNCKKTLLQKNSISPFFDASGNKNDAATIRIGQEICCIPYAGFFMHVLDIPKGTILPPKNISLGSTLSHTFYIL